MGLTHADDPIRHRMTARVIYAPPEEPTVDFKEYTGAEIRYRALENEEQVPPVGGSPSTQPGALRPGLTWAVLVVQRPRRASAGGDGIGDAPGDAPGGDARARCKQRSSVTDGGLQAGVRRHGTEDRRREPHTEVLNH